ncbi:MAG: tetratricopeptide repeat protein [Chitinophagales bacterium]
MIVRYRKTILILMLLLCRYAANGTALDSILQKANAYIKAQQYEEAIKVLDKFKGNKNQPDIIYTKGIACVELKRYDEAKKYFTALLSDTASDYKAWFGLGLIESDNKKYNNALDYYTKSIKKKNDFTKAYAERANLYLNAFDDIENALSDLNKAIDFEKDDTGYVKLTSYLLRSTCYASLGFNRLALNDINKVIAYNPRAELPRLNRANIYAAKDIREYDSALTELAMLKNNTVIDKSLFINYVMSISIKAHTELQSIL